MCYKCSNSFLALLIIVFSFWVTSFSWWVILIAGVLIFINAICQLAKEGFDGNCMCGSCKTGSELFMEKSEDEIEPEPSKKEVRETLKRKVPRNR